MHAQIGLVVYIGEDTKVMMNHVPSPRKVRRWQGLARGLCEAPVIPGTLLDRQPQRKASASLNFIAAVIADSSRCVLFPVMARACPVIRHALRSLMAL